MVGGIHTHLDDKLASQYQSIDWTQHVTCPNSIAVAKTCWLLVSRVRKRHTRPALTWTVVSTFSRSHQQALGNRTKK